jgi:GT2 family glycosyltransferase
MHDIHVPASDPRAPLVTVIAHVGREEVVELRDLRAEVRAQRGVQAELVVVDHTAQGLPALDGVRLVRCATPGRGAAWRAALAVARGRFVAWHAPACRMSPGRLATAVARLEAEDGCDIVTCDYHLHDDQGRAVERVFPAAMGEAPGPFWSAGVVARRAALGALRATAFAPVELELWQALRSSGRAAHVAEVGFTVDRRRYAADWEASRQDAALVAVARAPFTGERPVLSVSICTYDRRDVLVECLEAFSRQVLPPGTFELVVVDDGSSDGTAELLGELELPVPMRVVRQANGGLAAARNAGLAVARGALVLFVNDDTLPFPGCVEQHLRTHAALGQRTAVLGSFEQPAAALDNALLRYLERSTEVFGFSRMTPRALHDGLSFYTCNVSVPLEAVREAGCFDPAFRHYGCEDTDLGLRLEAHGYRVYYEPGARALHRHVMDFDYIRARQQQVARAYVRLFRKHPEAAARWGIQGLTGEDCWILLEKVRDALPAAEAAARELARIDVGALEALGGDYREAAADVLARLGEVLPRLNRAWWHAGYLAGFQEHGLAGLAELGASVARELPTRADVAASRRLEPARPVPELTVIVPTRDRPRELAQLLEHLAAQDLAPGSFEVLVVDDASSPPAEPALCARPWPFQLEVLRQEPAGPAAARNLALARARGALVVFFNDDAVPAADNLRWHLLAHRGRSAPLAVIGTFRLLPERVTDSFTRHVETSNALFAQPLLKAGVLYGGSTFCTGNLSIARALLEEVGGFDASFPYAGGEDTELGIRLERRLGVQVLFEPRARAQHDHALDVRGFARRQRVLGWAVQRIEELHPGAGLVPGWPLDAAHRDALRARLDGEREAHEELLAGAAEICAREARAREGPAHLDALRGAFDAVREHEFGRGLLAGLEGALPLERAERHAAERQGSAARSRP